MNRTLRAFNSRNISPLYFMLLIALTILWGFNWPAMKIVLMETSVWWFRAICLAGGGAGLMFIAIISHQKILLKRSQIKDLFICGLFLIFGWHIFTGYGVSSLPAGRSVIIAFTMPLWAVLLGVPLLNELISRRQILAVLSGLSGLIILIGPDLVAFKSSPLGVVFMLGAAISWALGTILFKRMRWSAATISVAAWLLLGGAIPFFLGAVLIQPAPNLHVLSDTAIMAFAYVLIFPMMFCQWAYLKIVSVLPTNVAAISTLAIPIVGVFSSSLILGEEIGSRELLSLILISGALAGVLLPQS